MGGSRGTGQQAKEKPKPVIVMDGLNFGRSYQVGFGQPNLDLEQCKRQAERAGEKYHLPVAARAIKNAIDYFKKRGYAVKAFLPEFCYNGGREGKQFAVEYKLLAEYVEASELMLTPGAADDDTTMILYAQDKEKAGYGVKLLTNDKFLNHIDSKLCTQE